MRSNVGGSQQKITVRKRRRAIFVTLLSLTAFSFTLTSLSLASFLPEINIDEVTVQGTQNENPEAVSTFVDTLSANNFLSFFSGRNFLLYRTGNLEASILKAFPRIDSVNVSRVGLTSATVDIKERVANALWCPDISVVHKSCLQSDENGYLFASLDLRKATTSDFVLFATTGQTKNIGDSIVATKIFKNFGYFLREMKTLSLDVVSFVVNNDSLTLTLKKGGKLIIDPNQDLTKALKLIDSLKNNKDLGFGTDSFMQKLDYFDLRYTGKAIYKMKGIGTKATTSTTTKNF